MKEKELIKLGFERVNVSAEESGEDEYYYYIWEPYERSSFCLITNSSDEIKDDHWQVNIFNDDIVFEDKKSVKKLIKAFKNAKYNEKNNSNR